MTRKELAEIIGVDIKTLSNWEKDRPELVRLINLGIMTDKSIEETEKLLKKLKEIQEKANSGRFELK